jgi:hypothetical protein
MATDASCVRVATSLGAVADARRWLADAARERDEFVRATPSVVRRLAKYAYGEPPDSQR